MRELPDICQYCDEVNEGCTCFSYLLNRWDYYSEPRDKQFLLHPGAREQYWNLAENAPDFTKYTLEGEL